MSSGAPHPPRDDADAMRWVANVLLGELADDPEIVVGPKAPSGHRVLWTFSMLPGGDDPYVLIPADAPRAAAAAVHGLGNPLRSRDRAVEAAAGLAMRARVGPRFAPSLVVSAPGPVARHRTLPGHLATVLGRDDAVCAVILGRRRPNRKPVLKMLAPDGEVLAYAKVGWNDLTANLVRAEADAMARIAAAGPRTFRVPRVLASGPWAGLELLVTAPAPATTRGDGPPLRMPGDATREVAAIHGVEQGMFAASAYRAGLVSRLEAGEADDTTALLRQALASLDDAWGQASDPLRLLARGLDALEPVALGHRPVGLGLGAVGLRGAGRDGCRPLPVRHRIEDQGTVAGGGGRLVGGMDRGGGARSWRATRFRAPPRRGEPPGDVPAIP